VEPKFMQDGQVEIRRGDVIANLPYDPNCTLWFDHHVTNATLSYGLALADKGVPGTLSGDRALAKGLNTYRGKITHPAVAAAFGLPAAPLEEVAGL